MANGSHHEGPARGDRLREKYARLQRRAQTKLDRVPLSRDLPAYREEMDSVSEVTLGKDGLKAKGPPWVLIVISVLVFAAFVAWLLIRR